MLFFPLLPNIACERTAYRFGLLELLLSRECHLVWPVYDKYALLVKTNCVSIRYTLTIHLDADNVSNLQKNQNDVDLDICTGCD